MDNKIDNTFESANRVYDSQASCPTIPTCGGGDLQPKILEVKKLADAVNTMDDGTCRTIKNQYQKNSIENFESQGTFGATAVVQKIVSMRGRNPDNPSDRTSGIKTEQRLEIQPDNICNTLTSVQKDNLVLEIKKEINEEYHKFLYEIDGEIYLIRIRKLTPKECWRLMDFTDEDFEKAEKVVSNTQLYKQAGNSIVKNCLVAIFGQMIPGKENIYKERMMRNEIHSTDHEST